MNVQLKEMTEAPALRPATIQKILVAYDATDEAYRALDLGIRLATAFGGSLSVLTVVPQRPGRAGSDPWDDRDHHVRELVSARALLKERGIEARFLIRAGEVAQTIEHAVDEGQFDTVVIGSRSLGLAARVLQGSVSEHVTTHTRATVVVAH